jgi:hypothetical protein
MSSHGYKIRRDVAVVALLLYAGGTGRGLCDLCPAPFLNGMLALPHRPCGATTEENMKSIIPVICLIIGAAAGFAS